MSSLIRVYTVCHSVCIFWTNYPVVKRYCSNFRIITANFLSGRIFRSFTVVKIDCFSIFSKFVVFSCLLVFSLLFSLRLDNTVTWSYWLIFLPIWIWKGLVIVGAIIGSYVWFRNPQYRYVKRNNLMIIQGQLSLFLYLMII